MAEKFLNVGAARLDISPTPDMLPIKLSFTGGNYEAVREGEGLTVRAIVIDNGEKKFLFEAFELGGVPIPDVLNKEIEERFGITKEYMLLTGTHNHSAPKVYDPPKEGEYNKYGIEEDSGEGVLRWSELVHKNAIQVIEDAMSNMKPARIGFATDKSYININRDELFDDGFWMQGRNWEGCSDKTVAALRFTDYDGNIIGVVLNYAMHDVMNFCAPDVDGKIKITCGIPGIACKWLERYLGGDAVVMWQSGAAGNQNPNGAFNQRFDVNGTMYSAQEISVPGASYALAICTGERHAVDALRAIKNVETEHDWAPIKATETIIELPGQRFPEGVDPMYHRLMVDNLLVSRGYLKPGEKYEKKLVDMIPVDEKVPMRAQLAMIGDVAYYGVACELYNEIGVLCKENSPLKNTVITTHIGAKSVGYVLDDDSKGHKVFQSFGQVREGESNGLVLNGMLNMFKELL